MWCGTCGEGGLVVAPERDHFAIAVDVGVEAHADDAVVARAARRGQRRRSVRRLDRRQPRPIARIDPRAGRRQRRVRGDDDEARAALGRQPEVAGVGRAGGEPDRRARLRLIERRLQIAARGHIDGRARRGSRAVADGELRTVAGRRGLARVVLAVALLRVAAASDVDERESDLPLELAVDGALHERRQVERDLRSRRVRHRGGGSDLTEIASGRLPGDACLPVVPGRLRFLKRCSEAIGRDRTRRALRAQSRTSASASAWRM